MTRRESQMCEICGTPHAPSCAALDRLWDAIDAALPDDSPAYDALLDAYHADDCGAPGPSLVDVFLSASVGEIADLERMWALPAKEGA